MTSAAHAEVEVPLDAGRAFALFTEGLGEWWPREYTWSQDALESIGMDPRAGGLCTEHGPEGFRCDWGRVVAWEPPGRLVLLWQIAPTRAPEPDPARSSEVEVRFSPAPGEATRVVVEHRAFERHGDGGGDYGAAMASPQGWPYILGRFAEMAERIG